MSSLYDNTFTNLLPSSLKVDPFLVALGEAIEIELKAAYREAESLSNLFEVDKLPEFLLDHLAYQKHVDYYDFTLPIENKRDLIKKAIFFHRQKGTIAAVEDLINTVFGDGQVTEWFEYGGLPFHFKVLTSNPTATHEKADQFIQAINTVKRKTAVLEKVELTQLEEMDLYFGGVLHIGDNLEIKQVI